MAFYLHQFAYTAEALATMTKNPQDRSAPVKTAIEKLGGRMIGFYYCFGEFDGLLLFEAPDDTTATAAVLLAALPGHLKASKTTKLFTAEETMEAMRKAGSLAFQGPSHG